MSIPTADHGTNPLGDHVPDVSGYAKANEWYG
jgi:hypothetical protein